MNLDPNAANLYKLMLNQVDNYQNIIDDLEAELDRILRSKNLTIVDLYHRIAIRLYNTKHFLLVFHKVKCKSQSVLVFVI